MHSDGWKRKIDLMSSMGSLGWGGEVGMEDDEVEGREETEKRI